MFRAIGRYWPLACAILVAALVAAALTSFTGKGWMSFFMGIFLSQFALFKLFRPSEFADAFQMYDLVAKKSRAYAFAYPLIELALSLCYLASFQIIAVCILTILILGTGAVGVVLALTRGLDVRCACMGTVLDVPLSTVTLAEDIGMIAMAILILVSL